MTMAYRRRQGMSRASTFTEESIHGNGLLDNSDNNNNNNEKETTTTTANSRLLTPSYSFTPTSSSNNNNNNNSSLSSSLAAQAIKASAARRDPSLSFALNNSSLGPAAEHEQHHRSKSCDYNHEDPNSKSGFWGVLANKAKDILEDENTSPQHDYLTSQRLRSHSFNTYTPGARNQEGRILTESKLKVASSSASTPGGDSINQPSGGTWNPWQQQQQLSTTAATQTAAAAAATTTTNNPPHSVHETQLKASRDVAMATAAKAKLLLRELKTVKADLAFAKARCAQLEEENKLLRDKEGREKGQNRADDDLIRLQLETLLAEKARLASENEVYSRENRFLREIVEYHQLTMQDYGLHLDDDEEDMDEVTEQLVLMSPRSMQQQQQQQLSVLTSPRSMQQQQQQHSKSLFAALSPRSKQQDNSNNNTPQDHEALPPTPSASISASVSDNDQHTK